MSFNLDLIIKKKIWDEQTTHGGEEPGMASESEPVAPVKPTPTPATSGTSKPATATKPMRKYNKTKTPQERTRILEEVPVDSWLSIPKDTIVHYRLKTGKCVYNVRVLSVEKQDGMPVIQVIKFFGIKSNKWLIAPDKVVKLYKSKVKAETGSIPGDIFTARLKAERKVLKEIADKELQEAEASRSALLGDGLTAENMTNITSDASAEIIADLNKRVDELQEKLTTSETQNARLITISKKLYAELKQLKQGQSNNSPM